MRARLASLTQRELTPLDITPAQPIASLKALCTHPDAETPSDLTCTAGETVAQLGDVAVQTYTVSGPLGSETMHLIWRTPDGKRFATRDVHSTYNPGAFGIFEETEKLQITTDGPTLTLYAKKQRSDSDMGDNEVQVEVSEHRLYCGLVDGVPHCTQGLTIAYSGERGLIDPTLKDGLEHDLWKRSWALAVSLDGKILRIGSTGGELPKGTAEMVGNHPLPW